jgi:protein SCO1/2
MPRRSTIAVFAAAGIAGIAAGVGLALRAHHASGQPASGAPAVAQPSSNQLEAQGVWPPRRRLAPDFRLRDQAGRPFSLRTQQGRVILLTFLNSHCKQACPVEGRLLADVQQTLPRGHRPTLVVVDINPRADTAATTKAAARKWRFALPWFWVRGRRSALAPLWRRYGIDVRPESGDISHSTVVYVIDQAGYERMAYLFPFTVHGVASAVRLLERPRSR